MRPSTLWLLTLATLAIAVGGVAVGVASATAPAEKIRQLQDVAPIVVSAVPIPDPPADRRAVARPATTDT